MNRGLLRLYAIGIIMVILMGSMPQGRGFFQDKLTIYVPQIQRAIQLTYDTTTAAVLPLIGKLKKPELIINGQAKKVDTTDNLSLEHGQSLSADQIDTILADVKSPAAKTGSIWISLGQQYNIDAAYILAIFMQESGAATNPQWIGWKENGTHTYNVGNLICSGFDPNMDGTLDCYKGFRDYSGISGNHWYNGLDGAFSNLAYYRDKNKIQTYDRAIETWAPPTENNTGGYIQQTKTLIQGWRRINTIALTTNAEAISAPISLEGEFGVNVKAALDSNLRDIIIKDGEQWSFNKTVGNPSKLKLFTVGGQYGGGWCDLACRYVQVFKGLGLRVKHIEAADILPTDGDIVFIQHGGQALYNCSVDESPFIWNNNGKAGFSDGAQDLIINNNTGKTIHITVVEKDNNATVIGNIER